MRWERGREENRHLIKNGKVVDRGRLDIQTYFQSSQLSGLLLLLSRFCYKSEQDINITKLIREKLNKKPLQYFSYRI